MVIVSTRTNKPKKPKAIVTSGGRGTVIRDLISVGTNYSMIINGQIRNRRKIIKSVSLKVRNKEGVLRAIERIYQYMSDNNIRQRISIEYMISKVEKYTDDSGRITDERRLRNYMRRYLYVKDWSYNPIGKPCHKVQTGGKYY